MKKRKWHSLEKSEIIKLLNSKEKDNVIDFEDLGVDYLFIDEAHNYKNCARRCYIR